MATTPNTLLEMSRSLRLYIPNLPVTLAEQFIRDRYRRILDRRDWSGTRKEGEFLLGAAKTDGTVALTRGSATVTGTSTTFTATDVGRQFKAGVGSAVYTIATRTSATSLTLDREYGGTTDAAATYTILDAYVSPPADFLRFLVISDPVSGWRLRHWITAEELMAADPQRTAQGQPYILADRMYNSDGEPQYEAWPYSTSARNLYYVYICRGADLIDPDDTPIWPIRSDAIVSGALADAARWPGTADAPNPYFSRPDLWKTYDYDFEDKMIELERRDDDIFLTSLQANPWSQYPVAPFSASFIQSHV